MDYEFKFDNIIFATREEAEDVFAKLAEIMEEYEIVRVADLYDLAGLATNYHYNNYVWFPSSLKNVVVSRVRDGWVIDLPKPVPYKFNNYATNPVSTLPSTAKVTYRSYTSNKPKPAPKTLTIRLDYAGIDEDEFDNVLAKAVQYAQTITDREVIIDIC